MYNNNTHPTETSSSSLQLLLRVAGAWKLRTQYNQNVLFENSDFFRGTKVGRT